MGLPEPAERHLVHNRRISCSGYVRADGHFDIEAELIDSKTYDFPSDTHGTVYQNTPYHHMQVRITVDLELIVTDAAAITLAGPYQICPQGAQNITNLIGLKIGPGWKRRVQTAIGGPSGCTHITELTGPMATTAYQTIGGEILRRRREQIEDDNLPETNQDSSLKNSCIAFSQS
jgi:hypothetical protein